jgi:hypothetical protein
MAASRNSSHRYVSEPLLALLQRAGIAARDVDDALDRQALRWAHTLLRHGDPSVCQLREGSGINVVGIARKYRRLLTEIEQRAADGSTAWHYRELGRAGSAFRCAPVPATALAALPGRRLGDLIKIDSALAHVTIVEVTRSDSESIELVIAPRWQMF